jgi:hypothetical protein
MTERGAPFTPAGFGNWSRDQRRSATFHARGRKPAQVPPTSRGNLPQHPIGADDSYCGSALDGGVAGATDRGGIPVECGTGLFGARQ